MLHDNVVGTACLFNENEVDVKLIDKNLCESYFQIDSPSQMIIRDEENITGLMERVDDES